MDSGIASGAASSSSSFASPASELQEALALHGLAVSSSQEKGRCLIACRDFLPGQAILEQDPYVSVLAFECRGARCDSCFSEVGNLRRCSACKHVLYCSYTCQRKEWKLHQDECVAIRHLKERKNQIPTPSLQLMLRLLLKRKLQLDEGIGRSATDNYEIIELLPTHMTETSEDRLVLYAQMANLVAWIADGTIVDVKQITQLFCRFACNAHTLCDEELRPLGTGLFPVVSIINHSCEPNAVLLFEGKRAIVRAVEQINAGTELTLSYIELGASAYTRQKALKEQYYFTCQCPRCTCARTAEGSLADNILEGLKCKNRTCQGCMVVNTEKDLLCQLCGTLIEGGEARRLIAEAENVTERAHRLMSPGSSSKRADILQLERLQQKIWHPLSVHLMHTHDYLLKESMSEQDWQSALNHCRVTIPAYERAYPPIHPLKGLQFYTLGKLELYLGNTAEAVKALTKASDILVITHGSQGSFMQGLSSTLHDAQSSLAHERNVWDPDQHY